MKPNKIFFRFYKIFSLAFCIIFLVVGFIFLILPGKVLVFFNTLSSRLEMPPSPVDGVDLYLALAVAYMYLVGLMAFLMWRHPENPHFPFFLAHGKLASSLLSLLFFAAHRPYLIFLVNFVVDGLIGAAAWMFYWKLKKIGP